MKNQTYRSSAVALCAMAALSLATTTQAGPSIVPIQTSPNAKAAKNIVEPIALPGGDPINNPGAVTVPVKTPPIKAPKDIQFIKSQS